MGLTSKSTLGFGDLKNLKFKQPLVQVDDITKLGIADIDTLTDEAKALLIDIIQYGEQKKSKVKVKKLSLRQIHIVLDALYNRKAEVDQVLFNEDSPISEELEQMIMSKQNMALEIIGTYRYNLAETINILKEEAIVIKKREDRQAKRRKTQ